MIPKSELRTKKYLLKHGYWFMRAGRSFGPWDFVCCNDKEIIFIQTKCNQGPRSAEMASLIEFNNYPQIPQVKKQIWIWKKYQREPIIKEVPNGQPKT